MNGKLQEGTKIAQAYRSHRNKRRAAHSEILRVEGCYNFDQKVVVEWEMWLNEALIHAIMRELPGSELRYEALRTGFSASCFERYEDFNDGVVTNFRLNRQSTLDFIQTGLERGLLEIRQDAHSPDERVWSKPTEL